MAKNDQTAHCMKLLAGKGLLVERVERWIPSRPPRTYDLFGILDVLAVNPTRRQTIGVQVTSRGELSKRRRKMIDSPHTRQLIRAGWRLELWGYDKRGKATRLRREVLMWHNDNNVDIEFVAVEDGEV